MTSLLAGNDNQRFEPSDANPAKALAANMYNGAPTSLNTYLVEPARGTNTVQLYC